MLLRFTFLLILSFLLACTAPPPADTLYYGGPIYTVNPAAPEAEAVAVQGDRIVFVGTWEEAQRYRGPATELMDLGGNTLVPGLIESHAHLLGLGYSQLQLDLSQVKNYEELVAMVAEAVQQNPSGTWITGRGWHLDKWEPKPTTLVKGYQTHEALSAVSPDHPVFLKHASGHAAFANAKAMELAGIGPETEAGEGGEVVRYPDGRPTGIFSETAQAFISKHLPEPTEESDRKALTAAVQACLEHGLTSFQDAGSSQADIDLYQEFVDTDKLGIRLYVMLSGGDTLLLQNWYTQGPLIGPKLTVRAIKLYADGALGSWGAWLTQAYEDRSDHFGNPIMPLSYIQTVANEGLKYGFQVCTHAIGDRANHEVLNQYETAFEAHPDARDHRYRIEHAQHLNEADIARFGELEVIASMQGIHLSSDRPWAIDRLGRLRILRGAYVWQKLYEAGATIINGTDAPVEPINPIACFYASVTRQTLAGKPEGGYEADQKMTRAQALRSYTLDAAFGAFQEQEKGSLEVGKLADFTVLSQDIMQVPDDQLLATEVQMTVVGGQVKFKR